MATSSGQEETKKLQLYSYHRSSCSFRVRIALNLKGLNYEYKAVNLLKGEQHSPEYLKVNPIGYVPALVDGDILVSDSFAIVMVIEWMKTLWPLKVVGPTIPSMYLDRRLENDNDYGVNLIKPNHNECMEWLNDKPKGSVVYVAFGSYGELGPEQMEEVAWGLHDSSLNFLWVVRASEEEKLPKGFVDRKTEKGLVVAWCRQLEVLSHESIGCFVTHCGFNSTLEAISLGVPVVAMPQWTDQITNAKCLEDIWGVGVRVKHDEKGIVRRGNLVSCIKAIMEGEQGVVARRNAKKWRDLTKEAVAEGGSSDKDINVFVSDLNRSR